MADKSIIVAISANAAYNTAVVDWGWQCDRRNKPEFQTREGIVVSYLPEGKLNTLRGDIDIYLGYRWEYRSDEQDIQAALDGGRFKLGEARKYKPNGNKC